MNSFRQRWLGFRAVAFSLIYVVVSGGIFTKIQAQDPALPDWPESLRMEIGRTDAGLPLIAYGDRTAFQPDINQRLVLLTIPQTASKAETISRLGLAAAFRQRIIRTLDPQARCLVVVLPEAQFPPQGPAYHTTGQRTAAALWRALAWLGVDSVVEGLEEETPPGGSESLFGALNAQEIPGFGKIPAVQLSLPQWKASLEQLSTEKKWKESLLALLTPGQHSKVRQEFNRRRARTPQQVVEELLEIYGHQLSNVMYQPALALIARRRFDAIQGKETPAPEVGRVLEPYLKRGVLPANVNGSVIAGHLVFADWALATKDPRAVALVQRAANVGFDAAGEPLPAMPSHYEMSDAVFMGCPILTSAARLTHDQKYLDQFARHLEFIQKLDLRGDGLYRNSPLCDAAWGRGNGFPMLGLALSLTDLKAIQVDKDSSAEMRASAKQLFEKTRADIQHHAAALLKHQDLTGMWRQVIDEPSAYREMTATCMIGFALQRGVNEKWLDRATFQPVVDRAWQAVLPRIGSDGILLDVCTGTGKQKSLQGYYDRTAIFGVDERGGAMALIFAVERLAKK